jgi:putative endonuclease
VALPASCIGPFGKLRAGTSRKERAQDDRGFSYALISTGRMFIHIMTNRSKTLYTGVTNSLIRRVEEHKMGIGSGFTAKYRLDRLVHFERFDDIRNAIEREKRIKGWLRIKKISLIVSVNPDWKDLSCEWGLIQVALVPPAST